MAINTTTRQTTAFTSGNNFAFAFKVYEVGDVKVIQIQTSNGAETVLTITTNYTVTLNDDQNANPGGTVTLVSSGSAQNLATGYNIVITSKVSSLQLTEITNQGGFFPEVINDVLDKAVILDQQQQSVIDKTIRFPITQTVGGLEITENAATRANKTLVFDGSGDLSVSATVDGRDVSADGTKLDGIENNATADQTAAEIRTLVESASDSNVFTDNDHTKLNNTVSNVTHTGDVTGSEALTIAQDAVTTSKIAADAIVSAKIADNAISSEHYSDGSIDTEHIANDAITDAKLADSINSAIAANTAKTGNATHTGDVTGSGALTIANDAVTTAKIANDAVTADKLAHTSVTAGTYTTADITVDAQGRITSASSGNIVEAEIANAAVTTAKIAADAVDGTKIADDAIDSEHYTDGSIDTAHIANDAVTTDKLANSIVSDITANNAKVTNVTTNLTTTTATGSVTVNSSDGTNATISEATGSAAGVMSVAHHDKLDGIDAGAKDDQTASEIKTLLQSDKLTASEIATGALDGRYYTETESDARYFNVSTGDTIKDGDTFPDNDTTIATTAAINDRIIDLVDDVGGFVPIANETSFPNANPDAENGTGTIVSISTLASNHTSSGSGVITISNGTVGNSTVTITGTANSTTYSAGYGLLVETTSTLNTYTFHRLVPKATEVTTVATNATNIAAAGANTSNINSVVSNASNINTVAGVSGNVTTVAGISSNVTTVAGNTTNINAVAADATDIGTVAGKATEIGRLGTADAVADLAILGTTDVVADMNTLATSAIVSDMDTLADISANITTVAGISSNVTSVANNSSNINSAVSNASNINAAVSNASNINTVAGNNSNITTVAGANSNITTVAGANSNISTVAGSISNVNTVATNVSGINDFADRYRIASSAPSSNNDAGDLYFDTSANELRVYNGSAWQGGVTATGNLAGLGANTFTGNQTHGDNVKAQFGASNDLEIFHNGMTSTIDNNTGMLGIISDTILFKTDTGSESLANFNANGAIELFYDNSKKFETTSGGISVTGNVTVTGTVDGVDIAALNSTVSGITTNATHSGEVTGSGALTIADNVVDEANLKVSNTPTNGYVLTAQSGNTGGLTWAAAPLASSNLTLGNQSNSAVFQAASSSNDIFFLNGGGTSGFGMDINGTLIPVSNEGDSIGTSSRKFAQVHAANFYGDGSNLTGIAAGVTSDSQFNTVAGTNAGDSFDGTNATHNTLFGYDVGTSITTGDRNTLIGSGSGDSITSGSNNTAYGADSLEKVTTGSNNTGIGYRTLERVSTSTDNTAVGYRASLHVTSGQYNTSIGGNAGFSNNTGSYTTCLGYQAGYTNTVNSNTFIGAQTGYYNNGAHNLMVGALAGYNNRGDFNLFVGYFAGDDNDGSTNNSHYNVALGYKALTKLETGANQNTAVGYQAGDTITTGANNIIIGNDADATSATTSNEITLGNTSITKFRIPGINVTLKDNGGTPTNGHVLTVDANGEAGFAAAAAGVSSDAQNNTIAGTDAGNALTSSSANNTLYGHDAGKAINTGDHNTAVGDRALLLCSDGDDNVALGQGPLYNLTTGNKNTFTGNWSGFEVTTGSNNSGYGYQTLDSLTTADNNSAFGYRALEAVTTGANNTAIGYEAGTNTLVTGSNNILIGYQAAATSSSESNTITLGNSSITKFRVPGVGLEASASAVTQGGVFYENNTTVSADYTITNGRNAMAAGPITIASGNTVTVGANETLTIV